MFTAAGCSVHELIKHYFYPVAISLLLAMARHAVKTSLGSPNSSNKAFWMQTATNTALSTSRALRFIHAAILPGKNSPKCMWTWSAQVRTIFSLLCICYLYLCSRIVYSRPFAVSLTRRIIQHRLKNGPFKSRHSLRDVKSVDKKTFKQCAGFIRIEPLTAGVTEHNILDSSWVHSESYGLANQIMKKFKLNPNDVGIPAFVRYVKE